MDEIGRELDHVVEAQARAFENGTHIVEHLPHLGGEIVLAHHAAVESDRKLPGDIERPSSRDVRGMRVGALRSAWICQVRPATTRKKSTMRSRSCVPSVARVMRIGRSGDCGTERMGGLTG